MDSRAQIGVNNNYTNNILNFNLSNYDLDVYGTTTILGLYATIVKSQFGNIIFRGYFTTSVGGRSDFSPKLLFTGNPNVEFRSGLNLYSSGFSGGSNFGSGTWSFTTNNQSISFFNQSGFSSIINNLFIGNCTVSHTVSNISQGGRLDVNNMFISTNGKFINGYTTSLVPSRPILAIFNDNPNWIQNSNNLDITTFRNSIGYYGSNQEVNLGLYDSIIIGAVSNGIKSLTTDTELLGTLTINIGTFSIATQSLVVGGSTIFGTSALANFVKTDSQGDLIFVGGININSRNNFILSGNPDVEFRGGITQNIVGGSPQGIFNFGSGNLYFSTNNQTIAFNGGGVYTFSNISIQSLKSLTIRGNNGVSYRVETLNSTSNGSLIMGASFSGNLPILYFTGNSISSDASILSYFESYSS